MSKQNKSPKKRNKKRTFRPKAKDWGQPNVVNIESLLGDMMLDSTDVKKSVTTYETSFGKIAVGEGVEMYSLKNKALLLDILSLEDTADEPLNQLIEFEKLKDKYPNEPFVYQEIADAYLRLDEKEKFVKMVEENYQLFKGKFEIDLAYFRQAYQASKGYEKENEELRKEVFGDSLNLHEIYPRAKAFEKESTFRFYSIIATYFLNKKDYQLAKDCATVARTIQPESTERLDLRIRMKEDKIYRRKNYAITGGVILVLLTIIGFVIYGIVKFLQWIF